MRQWFVVLVTAALLLSLAACGNNEGSSSAPIPPESDTPTASDGSTPEAPTSTSSQPDSDATNSTDRQTTSKRPSLTDKNDKTTATTTTAKPNWETPMTNYKSNSYTECITYRTPLTNTYNKLTKDKELTVVYFGGSLTNGYGCTDINKYSWRARSGQWFKDNFPNADIKTVDTAIGESGTYLGTYRVQKDVIGSKPDLLFIEYAINDTYSGANATVAGLRFETIVREVRKALPYCDIVTVITTDKAFASQSYHLQLYPTAKGHCDVAAAYDLPVVNIGAGLVRNIAKLEGNTSWWSSNTVWKKYFKDNVHPYDNGHEQYYLCIKEYLENSLLHTDYSGLASKKRTLPAVFSEHLLDGNRQSVTGDKLQEHFVADKSQNAAYDPGTSVSSTSQTPHIGFYRVAKGGCATFTFEGTEFAMWTDLKSPAKLTYSVDGGAEKTIQFGSHNPTPVVSGLSSGKHTITVSAGNAALKIGALFTRDETKQTLKGAK